MQKTVITFGLIGGIITLIFVFLIATLCDRELVTLDAAEYIGYASMIIALSTVFFGIKSYRDNYAGGRITFWKGVQVGLLITAVASMFYYAGGELYNAYNPEFMPKFMKKYVDLEREKLRARGASDQEFASARAELENVQKILANPFLRFAISLTEILPVGVIVTLISAGLLRRKDLLGAEN